MAGGMEGEQAAAVGWLHLNPCRHSAVPIPLPCTALSCSYIFPAVGHAAVLARCREIRCVRCAGPPGQLLLHHRPPLACTPARRLLLCHAGSLHP